MKLYMKGGRRKGTDKRWEEKKGRKSNKGGKVIHERKTEGKEERKVGRKENEEEGQGWISYTGKEEGKEERVGRKESLRRVTQLEKGKNQT